MSLSRSLFAALLLTTVACSSSSSPGGGSSNSDGGGSAGGGGAGGGGGTIACVKAGTWTETFKLRAGSDAICPEVPSETGTSTSTGVKGPDCPSDCTCSDTFDGAHCSAKLHRSCPASGGSTATDCDITFDTPSHGGGTCTTKIQSAVQATCTYDIAWVWQSG